MFYQKHGCAEVKVAESPMYAPGCNIPHLAMGHMLRWSAHVADFATWGSGDSYPSYLSSITFQSTIPHRASRCAARRFW